jgi:hypothetical protein
MYRKLAQLFMLPALVLLAACGGDDSKKLDDALKNDLSLASQAYPYQQFVSPVEQGYAAGGYAPAVARYPAPVAARRSSAPVYRSSSTGTARQSTRVVKNTKRDAIIGAAAGAAIGAVTSRNKIKGAIIGGAAGGILGAVIGNNVDKKKVPN